MEIVNKPQLTFREIINLLNRQKIYLCELHSDSESVLFVPISDKRIERIVKENS